MGLEQPPGLPCLERKEKLPAVLAATAWEMQGQGGDGCQQIFPGSRSAIHRNKTTSCPQPGSLLLPPLVSKSTGLGCPS